MKITPHRKLLPALATLTAAAYFIHSDPPPPSAHEPQPQTAPDPLATPDPLALSLLAHLQRAAPAGARNLFAFVDSPPAPVPHSAPVPSADAPNAANPVHSAPPQQQPPVLTFYGYISARGRPIRAFFSDGSEIYIKSEGDLIAGRYRVLHIEATAVLEDTSDNRRLTLTLNAS